MDGRGVLSIKEAATYLNISVFTLRNWVSQGRVPYVKLGRRTVFSPGDLDDFIQANRIPRQRSLEF